MPKQKDYRLLNNSRFYILASSFLLSLAAIAWLRLLISSDQLFYIRSQQVFGLLAVSYWYLALIISPIGYVIGKQRVRRAEFARRAIGVSAFYFAFLHGAVALWGQLGGPDQIQFLPTLFKWSLLGGSVAFVILFVMAATSLDAVVKFMTYRRWKWLHRFGYAGGVLVILHVWTVGTHLAYSGIRWVAFVALIVLAAVELFRVIKLLNDKYFHLDIVEKTMLWLSVWVIVVLGIALIPELVQNYHSRHTGHSGQHGEVIKE